MNGEQVKPGYKRTEVGVIPEDWSVHRLENLLSRLKNGAVYVAIKNGEIPISRIETIANGSIDYEKVGLANKSKQLEQYRLEPKDILFSHINSLDHIGKVAIYEDARPLYHGMNLLLLRANKEILHKYLFYWLNSSIGRQSTAILAKQAVSQASISTGDLRNLLIPTPSIKEQGEIIKSIDTVDHLLTKLDQLIAKKRNLKQATMQQLLTGQIRLPGFSGEWELKLLGEVANIKTGSKNNQDKVEDGDYPFFVRSATVERINSYSHECEAILIPGEGGIGSIFHYINGRFDIHQRVYAITQFQPNVSGKYVHLYMSTHFSDHAMQNSVKATVDSLRLPTFQCFELKLPSTYDEQYAISTVISDLDAELTNLEIRRNKTRAVKQGMMQELLTGRIRLI
jgi:type I restriction enzyme S subunit